ncbi:MAG: tRNA dihydrouridine synthase DusB [Candidatus Brocadiia bacterium]
MLKIGNIEIPSRLVLAPMAGVSGLPFRLINRSFGCQLAFLEMTNARTLCFMKRRTQRILATVPTDRPLGIQLLGAEPDIIRRAMEILRPENFDIIDLNAACPVKKVVNRGEGAGLLKDPSKLNQLLKIMVANTDRPVTVKIRSGWDEDSINAVDTALAAQDAGVKALFIHGRTRAQGYSGDVDYGTIRRVKQALAIPVIASGNALTPQLIKKLFDQTGCDGVAVARGAMGNPWIWPSAMQFLGTGIIPLAPDPSEISDTMIKHLDQCLEFYGQRTGVIRFRNFFHWYAKELPGIRHLRQEIFHANTKEQILDVAKKALLLR